MLEIEKKKGIFRKKNIWFSERPFAVPDADVVHFYACRNKVDDPDFQCEAAPTLVIDLAPDLDTLWGNMGKKSCRYFINRAERSGISIAVNQDFDAFHAMYSAFIGQKGFSTTNESVSFMRQYCTLFTAHLEGELLAGALMLRDARHMRWLFGASRRLENDAIDTTLISCANRLAIWEAIKYAKSAGCGEFDLGGYYGGDDPDDPRVGINKFKEKFGGRHATYYTYWQYNSRLYSLAQKLKSRLKPLDTH